MLHDGQKCFLYLRVSTEMQIDGFSLDGQKRELLRYAELNGMEVLEIYEDAGKSGKSIEGRPQFVKMLSDIENGANVDYILVYKLSRFGRNTADIINSLELIRSYNVNLLCASDGIDSAMASGKLLISVLSAVAEIERENILEQTMNGRKEKARQGKWNGGFAPYGYSLERIGKGEEKELVIAEDEVDAIKIIFDKFGNTSMGMAGVAKYLNDMGIAKKQRQNNTLEMWSAGTVKGILDNPVYMGKIAYQRRKKEKVKGKNKYKYVANSDYILVDGNHDAIVDEELWQRCQAKRKATGFKNESAIGRERVHLLSGILRCPRCGQGMYTNRNSWTNKDGTYHEQYYYTCSCNRAVRGRTCDYRAQIREEVLEGEVLEIVRNIATNEVFAEEIKKRIGNEISTVEIDKEIAALQHRLRTLETTKLDLERSIDNLSPDDRFRDRKRMDLNIRLDRLYENLYECEEQLDDAKLRRAATEQKAITTDNVYKILAMFDKFYDKLSDKEKRTIISSFIKEIQVYEKGTAPRNIKSIEFSIPVYVGGEWANKISWENEDTVENVVLLTRTGR